MGILVADAYEFKQNGLTLSNFVASIGGSFMEVRKKYNLAIDQSGQESKTLVYSVVTMINFYATQASYQANLVPVMTTQFSVELTPEQITGDLFALVYAAIIASYGFTSVTNC